MKRDLTVDIAKGIGIVLVIIGHLNHFWGYEDLVPTLIYSFHMPLFIILSGYVFNYHSGLSTKEYCLKRFDQIIKPYFMFAAITFIYSAAINGGIKGDEVYGIFIGNGIDNHLDFNIALWFLPMLFLCNVIFWCVVRLSKYISAERKQRVALIIFGTVLTIIGYYMIIHQKRFPWGVETALFSQSFMLFGYMFKVFYGKYNMNIYLEKYLFVCAPIIVIIWWYVTRLNGRVDMNAGYYGNILYFFVTSICGFYMIWQISYLINKVRGIKTIVGVLGKESLYIMAYHIPATYIIYNAVLPYMPSVIQNNAWKSNMIGILYICTGDILIALLMRKLHETQYVKYKGEK